MVKFLPYSLSIKNYYLFSLSFFSCGLSDYAVKTCAALVRRAHFPVDQTYSFYGCSKNSNNSAHQLLSLIKKRILRGALNSPASPKRKTGRFGRPEIFLFCSRLFRHFPQQSPPTSPFRKSACNSEQIPEEPSKGAWIP